MFRTFYNPKGWLRSIALKLHYLHENAYSHYKLQESGFSEKIPLDLNEKNLYLLMQPALKTSSSVVYDIGAANGKTARFFCKLKNIQSVHAFEPVPYSYQKLKTVADTSEKLVAHNIGLGSKESIQKLYINNWINSSSFLKLNDLFLEEVEGVDTIIEEVNVPIFRLDDYVSIHNLPLPHLIKIDVQGYEKEVISGGETSIRQAKYCFMEMSFRSLYKNCCLFDDVYQIMRELNFKLIGVSKPMIGQSGSQLQIDGLFENERLL